MTIDIDTFLTALYTIVDDLYQQHFAPYKLKRRGPEPLLADSEVLTLAICTQWFGTSENKFIGYAQRHWRSFFPRLLSQSQTNRRTRDLAGVLVHMVSLVSAQLETELVAYEAFDGLPVPLMRRCRGNKHRLFGDEASVGRGGSDKDWYYGCKMLISVTPTGVITGFVLGPASTQERWLADAFLCWRKDPQAVAWEKKDIPANNKRKSKDYVGPTGLIWPRDGAGKISEKPYIADGGYSGPVWTKHWAKDYQAQVFTPESYKGKHPEAAKGQHRRWRHVVETVNGHLEQVFHLLFPKARSRWGLLTRVAAKLSAFNLGIHLNRLFGRPDFSVDTLFKY